MGEMLCLQLALTSGLLLQGQVASANQLQLLGVASLVLQLQALDCLEVPSQHRLLANQAHQGSLPLVLQPHHQQESLASQQPASLHLGRLQLSAPLLLLEGGCLGQQHSRRQGLVHNQLDLGRHNQGVPLGLWEELLTTAQH